MNIFEKYNDLFMPMKLDYPLCKKMASNIVNANISNKCIKFLRSKSNESGTFICPYGFTCLFGNNVIICGFAHSEICDKKKIKGHLRNIKGDIDYLTNDEYKKMQFLQMMIDYCLICSQTTHDLINSIGQLNSLLEEIKKKDMDDNEHHLFESLSKFKSFAYSYNDNSTCLNDKYNFIRENQTFEQLYQYWHQRKAIYDEFLANIRFIINSLDNYIDKNMNEEIYKGHNYCLSMLSVENLFSYRLKQHDVTINDIFGGEKINKPRIVSFNAVKALIMLSRTLSYHARKKGVSININSNENKWIYTYENILLVLYILIENAIKYSPQNCKIDIDVDYLDHGFDIQIRNKSNFISAESIINISKRGYSGENSKNVKSHGLGLYSACRIMKEDGYDISFDYQGGNFICSLRIVNIKKN